MRSTATCVVRYVEVVVAVVCLCVCDVVIVSAVQVGDNVQHTNHQEHRHAAAKPCKQCCNRNANTTAGHSVFTRAAM